MEHKTLELKQDADGWMIASTPAMDRDRDRVMPLGADLTNYAKNPLLLFGHVYDQPWALIGKAADVQIDMAGIRFKPELREPANDNDPMTIVRALWDQRLLRAASIGFNPKQYKDNDAGGRDFTEWELLEISLVPLPSNQEALRLAMKAMKAPDTVATETVTTETGQSITISVNLRESAGTPAVNDIAEDSEDEDELTPTAEAAGEAAPEDDDELTPEEEAALSDLFDNLAGALLPALEE